MSYPTLLDIAKRKGTDEVVGLIEEAQKATPEVALGAARTIRGRTYKTRVRTTVPTVGFRDANEGSPPVKSEFENRLVQTYILNPRFEVDKAVADSDDVGPEAYIAEEKLGIMQAVMQHLGKCFFYGTGAGGDAKAFPGLIQAYDATNMVVDAAGTSDGTCSSVFAVKFGLQHVRWVMGEEGLLEMSENRIESIVPDSSAPTSRMTAYVSELLAYIGVQVGSIHSVGRIKRLTADSGKGLSDTLIANLLGKFPAGVVPDVLFMSRRSQAQLRASRTATNATGAPAPFPTESFGVPIQITESILNTEALTL